MHSDEEFERRLQEIRDNPKPRRESPEERSARVFAETVEERRRLNAETDAAHAQVIPVPADTVAESGRVPSLHAVLAFMAEAGCCDECISKVRESDRVRVVERLTKGRERKRKEGYGWYAGTPPYGWRSRGMGRLEPVRVEQLVLDWMFAQRAEGYGWANIAQRLNEAGTPAPRGGKWHTSAVRRIVERGRQNPVGAQPMATGGPS